MEKDIRSNRMDLKLDEIFYNILWNNIFDVLVFSKITEGYKTSLKVSFLHSRDVPSI